MKITIQKDNKKYIYYYVKKKLHRSNAPAVLIYNNDILEEELYYINGKNITDAYKIYPKMKIKNIRKMIGV